MQKITKYYKKLCVCFCVAMLASCSAVGLGYAYGDTYIIWQIDKYFDLTKAQETWLEKRVKAHLAWHRQIELPRYIDSLAQWRLMIDDAMSQEGITKDKIMALMNATNNAYLRLANRIKPDAVMFLGTLSDDQLNHLSEYLKESNEKRAKDMEFNEQDDRSKREQDFFERMNDWFGSFDDRQVTALTSLYRKWRGENILQETASSPTPEQQRLQRQQQFLQFLRSKPSVEARKQWLSHWFVYMQPPAVDGSGEQINAAKARQVVWDRAAARAMQVADILQPDQLRHLSDELGQWQERLQTALE